MKFRLIIVLSLIVAAGAVCEVRADSGASAKLRPEAIEARIREHRMGELVVRTKPGAEVKVEQLRHEFWFGTAISNSMVPRASRRRMTDEDREKYLEVLAANFNAAVHENALKWHNCERTATGGFDYSTAEGIYKFCAEKDIVMRGHCMFWCTDRNVQAWVKQLDKDALREVVKRRAMDVTSRFKGRVEEFDLNNELIFGNFYRRNLGDRIIKDMADWGKQGNPKALLYLNEQGSLASGGRNADKYIALIKKILDQGVKIDGLGCQGHFANMFDPKKVQSTLDRLGQFNLPIKITEYDFSTDDEQAKAKHLKDFYTICFAHPAVEGILMWGFWEGAHWRPKAALWKRDWTETPAAETYRDLVFNKWWTKETGKADAAGIYRTKAFYGKYNIESQGKKQQVTLQEHKGIETLTFSY
ncbi:MAG: endo-1,4-beta-xylanase [Phycisphaerae bacterium]|nr:endo-1,4-beta-xylanase [Phycisphaerae bacterium]